MISIKTPEQLRIMYEGGQILGSILERVKKIAQPGINTLEIDQLAEKLIKKHGGQPSFKGYRGYRYATCISVNEEVVHGIPGRRTLSRGDIVGIDCGMFYRGLHTDSAVTTGAGKISPQASKLIRVARSSLSETIKLARPGIRLGVLQAKIEEIVKKNNFSVIRDLSGHGIGRKLQEDPPIPNFGKPTAGPILKVGMTLCFEPMVAAGKASIKIAADGWTVSTLDDSLSAHFEHTVAITQKSHLILTSVVQKR